MSEQEQAERAKAAEMASIYGDAQTGMAATQPATNAAYAPMAPAAPLDPMAQSLLGEGATSTASDGLAGLEALVGDDFAEPAPAPKTQDLAPANEQEPATESADAPASPTTSAGGRLELPAALSDMLEQGSDGPQ
tara:strand:- start:79 stop:483 length:405 start_codon:yes stop_codon:yes gene_type:complete